MELYPQDQGWFQWEARAMKLRKAFEILGFNLEAAARGGRPLRVDLRFILNKCFELEALSVQLGYKDSYGWNALFSLTSTHCEMIRCGREFRRLKYLLGGEQNSAWDIKLALIDRRHLCVHARMWEEDGRPGTREKHAIEGCLELIVRWINVMFLEFADLALILTDHRAMKSYCVLGLRSDKRGHLSAVKALADPEGAIYIRSDVRSAWGNGNRERGGRQSIYIRFQHDFSKHTWTRSSFSESVQKAEAVSMWDTEGRSGRESLQNALPELGTSAYADVPIPREIVSHNEAGSVLGSFQDLSANTLFEASSPQSGITNHYTSMATGSSGAFTAPEQPIDMYGFAHITSSAPLNAVLQGLLPYESRDWAAPVSMTSPEADSPWSERDGPPPPYALSPGTYHLRLEAATHPSPSSG